MSLKFGMDDLEDLVYFFMNAPIDKPFSKAILIFAMCKLNDVPVEDPQVVQDVDRWLAETKRKLASR